ncbi:MAG: hypothetical protein EBZ48_05885 [Proteobacteria bacterium]|nr:hypothetical protein [Pseudomonadota bacterium]
MTKHNLPAWLTEIERIGYRPYIATSARLLPHLNLTPFGVEPAIFTAEESRHVPFHEAYLLSNSLSFKSPDLRMPNWVLIDCVLMQTAVVGFMWPKAQMPVELLRFYRDDPKIDLDSLKYLPVSGQVASITADHQSYFGFSLFSLGRQISGIEKLGMYSRALALEVYKLSGGGRFFGISQYDNPALRIHGRFSPAMEIYQTTVPLHPKRDMTLIYTMQIDFDPHTLDTPQPQESADFKLKADDAAAKHELQELMKRGKRFRIVPPFQITQDNQLFLPIKEIL